MPEDSTPVTRYLSAQGIPHRLFRHPGPIASLEQAARERGQRPEQVVRSILFRLGEGEYVMVLVGGPKQIAWPKLRRYLGVSRISMASPEEVLAATGYPLGAVAPFGLPAPMRVLVDRGILEETEISLGSGEKFATVFMQVKDLLHTLDKVAELGDFL